jgi:hypothetical protein
LANEVARIDAELRYNTNHRHRFVDCAERYLAESKHRRSVDLAAWHVRLLTPYIGMLEIHQIHDATLKLFVHDRLASGVKASTVNRSLEVVRTVLHRAARSYRDGEGRPWLDAVLPLITRLPESPVHPTPSLGMSRTGSFPNCRRDSPAWFFSPSTPACVKAMSAAWSGVGRFRYPKSAAVSL